MTKLKKFKNIFKNSIQDTECRIQEEKKGYKNSLARTTGAGSNTEDRMQAIRALGCGLSGHRDIR